MVVARSLTCYRATEPHPFGLSLLKPVRQFNPFGLSLSKPGRHPQPVRAEPVEGCALVVLRAFVKGGGRESPGVRVTFFRVAERKSPKKGRPPVCDPYAVRRGKPASCRLRGAPWNSLCAARAARTTTASQMTRHGRAGAHAHPATAPPQAQPAGGGQPNIQTAIRAVASLGPTSRAQAPRAARAGPSEAMARRDVRFPGFPSVRAEKRRAGGACVCRWTHALR